MYEFVEKYKPIVYFHSDEKYFPSTVNDYILNCELMYKDQVLLKKIDSAHDIINFNQETQNTSNSDVNYSVKLKDIERLKYGAEWFIKGTDFNKDFYPQFPTFYAYIIQTTNTIIDIVYVLTYPFNGTFKSHKYDEEICVVRLDNFLPTHIGTSRHGGIAWNNYTKQERPEVYIAKGSHAFYISEQNHTRLFFFGNDQTNKGYRVDNLNVEIIPTFDLPKEYNYLNFIGARNYGESGHFTPKTNSYIVPMNYGPPKHSIVLVNEYVNNNIFINLLVWFCIIAPYGPIIYLNHKAHTEYGVPVWVISVGFILHFLSHTLSGVYFTVKTNQY